MDQHGRLRCVLLDEVVQLPSVRPIRRQVMAANARLLDRHIVPRLGQQLLLQAAFAAIEAARVLRVALMLLGLFPVLSQRGPANDSLMMYQHVARRAGQVGKEARGVLREAVTDGEEPNRLALARCIGPLGSVLGARRTRGGCDQ
jgi:hypothetical protein